MTTLDFYEENANAFFNQTIDVNMQNIYQPFLDSLLNGNQAILDVGCETSYAIS